MLYTSRCRLHETQADLLSARSAIRWLYHRFFDVYTLLQEPRHVVLYFIHQLNLHSNMQYHTLH